MIFRRSPGLRKRHWLIDEAILERLDDAFGLLVGGSRTAPRRQHTLRTVLDSRDLLLEREDGRVGRLTPRGRDVAGMIARGLTSAKIAELLVVSERTVDAHADNIRGKMGLYSRAEIAAWAVEHRLARAAPGGSSTKVWLLIEDDAGA